MEMFYKESKGTHSMVNTKEQLVELGQASELTLGNGWNDFERMAQGWFVGGDI